MTARSHRGVRVGLVAIVCVAVVGGCTDEGTVEPSVPPSAVGSGGSATATTAAPLKASDFDPASFDPGAPIDNRWFPLTPGTQLVLRGSSLEDGERLEHKVVSTVSDVSKEVAGVRVRVLWELDYTDGELEEAELAFFAQDRAGNVWHLGQYPEEYADGKIEKSPGWIAGEEGARAGIAMKAEPKLGEPSYAQGFAPPPINWLDRARTFEIGAETCVPVDCYEDVVITEEFERRIPGAFQLKYYAPDVGNVRVGWRGKNEEEREVLVLVAYRQLTARQMEKVREEVLALEGRAYRRNAPYATTTPAEVG